MTNKTVLITGASRGIGQAIANLMIENNYKVIGTATSDAGAHKITDYLQGRGYGVTLDISSQESIKSLQQTLIDNNEHIDVLINNAGITKDNLFLRMSDEQWGSVINTNLNSLFYLAKCFVKPMVKKRYGRIINIGSVVGSMGNAGQCNYSAAKAGLIGFTKSLAQEVASRNISVNAIAPGFIATDMTDSLTDEQKSDIAQKIPANRLGNPNEIAHLALFLASEQAGYINGETIHINGGMYMS